MLFSCQLVRLVLMELSLQFNEEENKVIKTGQIAADGVSNSFQLCLVGTLWTESSFNRGAFRSTLEQIWKLRCGVEIREIGKNLFKFQFFHLKDKQRVLRGAPWWFDKVLSLGEFDGALQNHRNYDQRHRLFG